MNMLKIGDSLFKRLTLIGVAEYKITGVRIYADNTQYETECQACSHGKEKCRVLISHDKNGFHYVTTLNDEENSQYFWHNDGDYYLTKNESHIKHITQILTEKKEKLSVQKKNITTLEKEIKEMEVTLDGLKEKAVVN